MEVKLIKCIGDGEGNFKDKIITKGVRNHESGIIDSDGNGDFDILRKLYYNL